jgi:hypothetical protein
MKSKIFQKSQNKAKIGQKSQNWPKRPKFSKKAQKAKKPKLSKIWLFCQIFRKKTFGLSVFLSTGALFASKDRKTSFEPPKNVR